MHILLLIFAIGEKPTSIQYILFHFVIPFIIRVLMVKMIGWDRRMSRYTEVSLGGMVAGERPLVFSCGVNHSLPDCQVLKRRYD